MAFDAPLAQLYDYSVPDGSSVTPGQRVRALLGRAERVGIVLAVHDARDDSLKPIDEVLDAEPRIDADGVALLRWISGWCLSSLGSTAAGLLPPPVNVPPGSDTGRTANALHTSGTPPESDTSTSVARTTRSAPDVSQPPLPEVLTGAGRERRLVAELAVAPGGALVIVSDIEGAARWAQRLERLGPVVRLDSGAADSERAAGWAALAAGDARLAVGTRSALLAPLAAPATLAIVDEHEAAHMPPGHPRIHARDVLLERARRERARLLLTAATPSVEMWWRTERGRARRHDGDRLAWPAVSVADTRGILRREPITPELARAVREALAAGGRVFLGVARFASALACDECGLVLRCTACGLAFAYARAAANLACRVCHATTAIPETCPGCRGRRVSPFGWGVERVEHAIRRRFPHARIARYEPEARGARAAAQRTAAAAAEVVIGTRGALRLFGPGTLALAGFVSPDQLLRVPDFRAGERMLALLWAAAERVRAGGALVIQSQNPDHHAIAAVSSQSLGAFYTPELAFRSELGYPPFRRLAIVSVEPRAAGAIGPRIVDALRAAPGLTVYGPSTGRSERVQRIVVKGGDELAETLAAALADATRSAGRAASRGIMSVEVDPNEWPS